MTSYDIGVWLRELADDHQAVGGAAIVVAILLFVHAYTLEHRNHR